MAILDPGIDPGARPTYSDVWLRERKHALRAERELLRSQIEGAGWILVGEADLPPSGEAPVSMVEELEAVQSALERIASGEFGLCCECSRPMSRRRLELVPWAARCSKCKSAPFPLARI